MNDLLGHISLNNPNYAYLYLKLHKLWKVGDKQVPLHDIKESVSLSLTWDYFEMEDTWNVEVNLISLKQHKSGYVYL